MIACIDNAAHIDSEAHTLKIQLFVCVSNYISMTVL